VVLVISVWGGARLVADLPLGLLIDRLPRGRLLLAGTLCGVGGSLVAAFAPSFEVLLAGRAISGLGAASISITAVVSLIDLSPPHRRGRSLGVYQAVIQAGATSGPVLAGLAATFGGWPAAFMIAAVAALIGAVTLWLSGELRATSGRTGLPPGFATPGAGPAPGGRRDRVGGLLLPLSIHVATFALFIVTGAIVQGTVPLFASSELGLGTATIGLVLGVATALRFVVGLIGAEMSDRVGRLPVFVAGMTVMIAALLIFPFVTGPIAFVTVTWMLAAGRLGNSIPVAMLSDHSGGGRMGRMVGANRFVGDFGLVIGPLLAGVLIDRAGYSAAFLTTAAIVIGATVILVVVARATVRRDPLIPALVDPE
jgi:MFS transporter, DHA1 family, multidrug resistance protein